MKPRLVGDSEEGSRVVDFRTVLLGDAVAVQLDFERERVGLTCMSASNSFKIVNRESVNVGAQIN